MPNIPKSNCLISSDNFRGLAITRMVLYNYSVGEIIVPSWFKHAQDIGLTINDLIAPLFIFTIGLTYGSSIRVGLNAPTGCCSILARHMENDAPARCFELGCPVFGS